MLFQTYMIFFYLWDSKEEDLSNVHAALFHTVEANRDKLEKRYLGFFKISPKGWIMMAEFELLCELRFKHTYTVTVTHI